MVLHALVSLLDDRPMCLFILTNYFQTSREMCSLLVVFELITTSGESGLLPTLREQLRCVISLSQV